MYCEKEAINLMHHYLDGYISQADETKLRHHLEDCNSCQKHFHELKRTLTLVSSSEKVEAPVNFTENVMKQLPTEKRYVKYGRWFKIHPMFTVAAILFVFIIGGVFSSWNQDTKLTVSKQDNLIIKSNTVIVPDDVVVEGNLVVENGDLRIDGVIEGDVTLINGKLINEDNSSLDDEGLLASADGVGGEIENVDRMFEWIWYQIKDLFKNIFSFN